MRDAVLVILGLAALLFACGDDDTPRPEYDAGATVDAGQDAGELCNPGSSSFCRCADRQAGTKTCLEGNAFGPCVCTDGG